MKFNKFADIGDIYFNNLLKIDKNAFYMNF